MLSGYKTYIIAAALGALAGARYLGYVSAEQAQIIEALLLGGGLAALRAGVAKI